MGDRAFEFADLMVLLTLDPNDSNDDVDIEMIDEILARRRARLVGDDAAPQQHTPHQRTVLHLVPDAPS